ncbi:hypothetical protein BLNAU_23164 [Blattamonas nauphoetae]|uniref:Uncharacterized protein n=1 Tax=Blattamonas nauphoetae TaxID=2049346 RepID=A0ABQ9WRH4_9EUKA|nr:hypothetical protein BLNAU_23164 [Blattamonas nauphoetae]
MFSSEEETIQKFDPNSELTFSTLVTLVENGYVFDDALQDKAVDLMKGLEKDLTAEKSLAEKLFAALVPSSTASLYGFGDSICILLSCPYPKIVGAAMSDVSLTFVEWSQHNRMRLVKTDLVSKILSALRPHLLPIWGNEQVFQDLIWVLNFSLELGHPDYLEENKITRSSDMHNHYAFIFEKVLQPSSEYLVFLCQNRSRFTSENTFTSIVNIMAQIVTTSPFHAPALDFVLESPITFAVPSLLSSSDWETTQLGFVITNDTSLPLWKKHSRKVVESGKQIFGSLFSEGYGDTLEQMMLKVADSQFGGMTVEHSLSIARQLGGNVKTMKKTGRR